MNAADLNSQLLEAVDILRDSLADLEVRVQVAAKSEREYRQAKATAYLATTGTVAEREANAERAVNELRFHRDMADGLKTSALEATRANRTIVSAVQTLAGMYREEMAFDRTGPREGP